LKRRHWLAAILIGVAVVLVLLWLARAMIAARFANSYFRQHGVESQIEIGSLGLSGVSGRFVLGPQASPDIAADQIELHFDPLRYVTRLEAAPVWKEGGVIETPKK